MHNDSLVLIRDRYGFELPQSYQTVLANGHFSTSPWENYWELQDCEWLSLNEIAAYQFLDFQIMSQGGFIPFAVSARRDEFCWRLDWMQEVEPAVVFCERGGKGVGYAPHFQGFLYRKILEEFAGYGPENVPGFRRLRQAVASISTHLPQAWAVQLKGLADHDFADWKKGKFGELFLLSKEDLAAIINRELAFRYLNEKFVLETGS